MIIRQFLLYWVICLHILLSSSLTRPKFGHLTITDGLSQSSIYSIYQDSQGYMWFGTEEGLNEYNGYDFKIYTPQFDDSLSISSNSIYTITEDDNQNIWIGTYGGGLNKLDRDSGAFFHFMHNPQDNNSVSSNNIWLLYFDSQGILWILTDGAGCDAYNPVTNQFIHYRHSETDPGSISDNHVYAIVEDHLGTVWIGTSEGLNRFDRESQSFTHFYHDPDNKNSLKSSFINVLFEDSAQNVWVGTNSGVSILDRKNESFINFTHDENNEKSISSNEVSTITEDRQGRIWIGTENGLNVFQLEQHSFKKIFNDVLDPFSLSENAIYSMYLDHGGVLWIGTTSSGLNTLYTEAKAFNHIYRHRFSPDILVDNHIYALLEDENDGVWVGTGNGLTLWNMSTQTSKHFQYSKENEKSISSNWVNNLFKDSRGTLWISTDNGLNKYNPASHDFTRYIPNKSTGFYWTENIVYQIMEYDAQHLLLGTAKGLYFFDPESNKFKHWVLTGRDSTKLDSIGVYTMNVDQKGILWIGTEENGLYRYDKKAGSLRHYIQEPNNPHSIGEDVINNIFIDSNGTMWIGTYGGGLNRYNPAQDNFTRCTVEDGLPNNVIYGILEDKHQFLWLSTNRGLVKFNPANQHISAYDVQDGLQSNEFNGGAYFQSQTGLMYFGGVNGFNVFYPDSIYDNEFVPPIVITDIVVNNTLLEPERYIQDPSADTENKHVVLTKKDYVLTINFAALNYYLPSKNQYAYILEDFDHDWITSGHRRTVTYTNLPPGHFVFRVKGSNNDGIWNEEGASIHIIVLPSFWQRWWVKTGLFALPFILLLIVYKIRENVVLNRNKILTESNAFKELLIDVITHDIKNPAGVIQGMSELVAESSPDSQEIKLIKMSSENLLSTINNVTTLVEVTLDRPIDKEDLDLKEIIEKLVKEHSAQFNSAGIMVTNQITEPIIIHANPIISEIFHNYINNAIKYAADGGEVIIECKVGEENITINIRDFGRTISEDDRIRIFERNIKLDENMDNGKGVGLAIVRRIADIHDAIIGVRPNKPKGNIFYLKLPRIG